MTAGVLYPNSGCSGWPICRASFTVKILVPPQALAAEMAKHTYVYFGATEGPLSATNLPAPKTGELGAAGAAATIHRLSADSYAAVVTYSFDVGLHAANASTDLCTIDDEAADGVGIPGTHGCGEKYLTFGHRYI
ncbi:MAG TPA: hypothetical protein VIZ43_30035 [Trebonia sp.]